MHRLLCIVIKVFLLLLLLLLYLLLLLLKSKVEHSQCNPPLNSNFVSDYHHYFEFHYFTIRFEVASAWYPASVPYIHQKMLKFFICFSFIFLTLIMISYWRPNKRFNTDEVQRLDGDSLWIKSNIRSKILEGRPGS